MVPFSVESWIGLVGHYNQSYWPSNFAVVPLVGALLWFAGQPSRSRRSMVAWLLCFCWLWCGVVFHQEYFSTLTWVAEYYGWLFILQAVLLVLWTIFRPRTVNPAVAMTASVSIAMMVFALLGLPLLQLSAGHHLSQLGWFALTPDSTALMTIGLLGYSGALRYSLVVIPVIWGIIVFANSWPLEYMPGMTILPVIIAALLWSVVCNKRQQIRDI